jgi:hypothetical protein
MILECRLDQYGAHQGKTLKYIATGNYKDMLCIYVSKPEYKNKYYHVDIKLNSRCQQSCTPFNIPNYVEITNEDFFDGINILDEIYEETKTNLEFRGR